jgi:peptidoglycan/LPS O-acetylase OafA/YrhL
MSAGSLGSTSRGRTRIPQIEGLRAFAALAVMGTHLALISGFTAANALGPLTARLNVGVALFFVLSAYLLYQPWVEARLNGGREPDARQYAVRRLLRILPAYWFALLALGLLLPDEVPGAFGNQWWAYFGLLQVYSQETILGGLRVAWSLSTEFAFYLVLPLIAWTAAQMLARYRREVQVRVELVALAVSVLAAFAVRHVVAREEWMATFPNTLVGKWPWFAVGLGLAVARAAWGACPVNERPWLIRTAGARPWAWWSVAGAVLLLAAYGGVLPRNVFAMTPNEAEMETLLFGAFALCLVAPIVLSAASPTRGPATFLAIPPVAWLGTVSYGIFLWHYPLARWTLSWIPDNARLFTVVACAMTLACAAVSWYAIEKPLMRLRFARRRVPAASPAVVEASEPAP